MIAAPKSVALQVEIVEPTIKTADVNNLGIGEVLGVAFPIILTVRQIESATSPTRLKIKWHFD